jgi:phytoene dehydrogenase-like protein
VATEVVRHIAGLPLVSTLASVRVKRILETVSIFEMHDRPGGLYPAWQRQGLVFDGCIHYLFGLSDRDAIAKLDRDGYNELPSAQARSLFSLAWDSIQILAAPETNLIKVIRTGDRTTLSQMMRLVEESQASKSQYQTLADRLAYWLTLIAIGITSK